jgi:hypothetical protein
MKIIDLSFYGTMVMVVRGIHQDMTPKYVRLMGYVQVPGVETIHSRLDTDFVKGGKIGCNGTVIK